MKKRVKEGKADKIGNHVNSRRIERRGEIKRGATRKKVNKMKEIETQRPVNAGNHVDTGKGRKKTMAPTKTMDQALQEGLITE